MAIGTAVPRKSMVAFSFLGVVVFSLAGLASYILFLFAGQSLPAAITRQVSTALNRQYGISLKVGKVTPGPFGRINLDEVQIRAEGDPDLLSVQRLAVSLDPVAWIRGRFAPAAAVGEITLVQPVLKLRRESGGEWNLDRFVKPSGGRSSVFRGRVAIRDGTVRFYGLTPRDWGAEAPVDGKSISISSLSGAVSFSPTGSLQFSMSGYSSLAPSSLIEASGKVAPATGAGSALSARVKLNNVDLAQAVQYLPSKAQIGAVGGGQADLVLDLSRANADSPYELAAEASFSQVDWRSPVLPGPVQSALGTVAYSHGALTVKELSADFLGTRFRVSGRVASLADPVLDLHVAADHADLTGLTGLFGKMGSTVKTAGYADLDASLKGLWRDPLVRGTVRFTGGYLQLPGLDRPLTDVNGEVAVKGRTLTTTGLAARYAGAQATVLGTLSASGDPTADLKLSVLGLPADEAVRLAGLEANGRSVAGRLSMTVDLKGPLSAPAVRGTAGLTGGRIDDLGVKDAQADFAYAGGGLTVKKFTANLESGSISGALTAGGILGSLPSYAFELNLSSLDIAGTLAALHVRTTLPVQGKIDGTLTGQGRGRDANGLVASATLSVDGGVVGTQRFDQVFTGFAWERGDLVVDSLSLSSADGTVAASGRVSASGELSGSITGERLQLGQLIRNLQLERFSPGANELGVSGRADVFAQLGGTLSSPDIVGELQVVEPGFRKSSFRFGEGKFSLAGTRLKLEGFSVRKGETEHRLDGEVRLGKETLLDLRLESKGASLGDLLNLAGVKAEATGTLEGSFVVRGTIASPVVEGKAQIARGSIASQPVDQAEATFVLNGGNLTVERLSAKSGDAQLVGRGEMNGGQLDFYLDAQHVQLAEINALERLGGNLSGTASFRGTVRGTPADPVLEGEVRGDKLSYADYGVDSVAGSIRATRSRLTMANVALNRGTERYVLSGEVDLGSELNLDLRARLDRGDIPELLRLAKVKIPYEISGGLTGVLRVWGNPKNPSARLMAETADARFGGMELSGDADIGLRGGEIVVNRLRLSQGDGLVVAIGKIGRDKAMDFRAHGQGLSIGPWLEALRLPVTLSGTAEVDLTLAGTLPKPQARATVRVAGGKMNGATFDTLSGTAVLSGSKLSLENAVVASGKNSLTVDGDLPMPRKGAQLLGAAADPGRFDLRVRMNEGDFSLLSFLAPNLTLAGPGSIDLRVNGPADAVRVSGEVLAKGVTVGYPALLGSITNLNGRFEFQGDRVSLAGVEADYNGGPVSAKGTVRWVNNAPDLDVAITGRGVRYPHPVFDSVVTTNLTVKGPWLTPTIEGRATLDKATLTLGLTRPAKKPSRWNPSLNISVSNREDVRVVTRDKSLDVRAYGNLMIRGSLKAPAFTGEAEASRGSINYLDMQFRIARGTADFAAYRGIMPKLDVLAETDLDGPEGRVKVDLTITGVVGQLEMNLDSDPPMSQAEIIGLFSLPGQISRLMTNERGTSLETEVARFVDAQLSNQVMGGLQNAVAEALQLDEFKLGQNFSEENLRIQIGKYLVDDLYMTYSRTFSTDPLETLRFEYRLRKGLLANTSFDNRGDVRFGLEAKHRF